MGSFSRASLFFIHLFSLAGAISCYAFNMSLATMIDKPCMENAHRAFQELVPAIVLHMEIVLRSAVVRTPHSAPYYQLFIMIRVVAVLLVLNSSVGFIHLFRLGNQA